MSHGLQDGLIEFSLKNPIIPIIPDDGLAAAPGGAFWVVPLPWDPWGDGTSTYIFLIFMVNGIGKYNTIPWILWGMIVKFAFCRLHWKSLLNARIVWNWESWARINVNIKGKHTLATSNSCTLKLMGRGSKEFPFNYWGFFWCPCEFSGV